MVTIRTGVFVLKALKNHCFFELFGPVKQIFIKEFYQRNLCHSPIINYHSQFFVNFLIISTTI